MADRVLTTHAGSLPRPDELADMIWARMDGEQVDDGELEAKTAEAVAELVAKQREVGLDVVSDGEMSKPGFSSYVADRFSGFGGTSEFQSDDVAPFPELAMKLFANPQTAHLGFSNCVGSVELKDKDAVHRDIARFKSALGDAELSTAFMGAIIRDRSRSTIPTSTTDRTRISGGVRDALSYEYNAIIDAGFNLQIDSPDMAMAAHARSVGSSVGDWHHHLRSRSRRSRALEGIPSERLRFHVCWGNRHAPPPRRPAGGHHRSRAQGERRRDLCRGRQSSPRPRVARFRDVELPDDKSVILGVIDVKSNYVEHPRLVADRLVQVGTFVGKDR